MAAAFVERRGPQGSPPPTLEAFARSDYVPLFIGTFLAVTILQRFALPGSGGALAVGLPVCLALVAHAVARGVLVVALPRLIAFLVVIAALVITLIARDRAFSYLSFAMLCAIYASFALSVELTRSEYRRVLEMFQRVMMLCAICGIVQFALQLPFGRAAMFPFDAVLPSSLFIQGFNLVNPIAEGGLLKSTGLWFLEASHIAQFLALAIVVEIGWFKRPWVLALFGSAYLLTFSGTGIVLLGACVMVMLILRGQIVIVLLLAGLAAVVAGLLSDVPPFSFFFARVEEFANPQASGSMRFLGPYRFVGDVLAERTSVMLFGMGPGSFDQAIADLDYPVQDNGWLKLLTEYGLVGAVPFMLFYLFALFYRSPDPVLSTACLVQFMFLGGYLNAYYVQFLALALVVWPKLPRPAFPSIPLGRPASTAQPWAYAPASPARFSP